MTETRFDNSTVGELNRETLAVSTQQGLTLLNVTYLRESTPYLTAPAESQQDITTKIGWVFGETDKLKALRFKKDYNFGISSYTLVEGVLEVSASSPVYQVTGPRYDIVETLQQYFGAQGTLVPILNGGESHFINP